MVTLESVDKKLDQIDGRVIELKTVLLGVNSDKGLVGQVEDCKKKTDRNTVILAVLIGSGVLGSGAIGVLKLFSG